MSPQRFGAPRRPPVRGTAEVATLVGTQLRQRVPARSLLLSLAALMIPLVATLTETVAKADLVGEELEMLIWLPALLPAFLLTYYRGWSGASVAFGPRYGDARAQPVGRVAAGGRAAQPPLPFGPRHQLRPDFPRHRAIR